MGKPPESEAVTCTFGSFPGDYLKWSFYKEPYYKVTDDRNGQSGIYGTGVFAKDYFKPGDIIEKAPLIMQDVTERETLQNTVLFDYSL